MDIQEISLSMGEKLKKLREEHGYSFPKLISELNERYGLKITDDSLKAYEIDNKYHSKAPKTPNMKMRVETLYCLADLYDVSVDYLLGKELVTPGEPEMRAASKFTGLSSESLRNISYIKSQDFAWGLDLLISSIDFSPLIYRLCDYLAAQKDAYLDGEDIIKGVNSVENLIRRMPEIAELEKKAAELTGQRRTMMVRGDLLLTVLKKDVVDKFEDVIGGIVTDTLLQMDVDRGYK